MKFTSVTTGEPAGEPGEAYCRVALEVGDRRVDLARDVGDLDAGAGEAERVRLER